MKIVNMELSNIKEYENNAKEHPEWQIKQIATSIEEFGFNDPIAIDENNIIIEGHGRYLASKKLGLKTVPVIKLTNMDEMQKKAYILAHNKLTMNTDFDYDLLSDELADLENVIDMSDFGFDDLTDVINEENVIEHNSLEEIYDIVPVSVVRTFTKTQKDIKNFYKKFGLNYAETREDIKTFKCGFKGATIKHAKSVSVFNPMYAHLGYKFFGREKDCKIIDPFAGGVVRGHVADVMGLKYTGIDLRSEQIEANKNCNLSSNIKFIAGDSTKLKKYVGDEKFNLSFSCPPYADLEVYSDNPRDLSNVSHEEFFVLLKQVYSNVYDVLEKNSFCVIVLGDVRDRKTGMYIDVLGKTKQLMREIGFGLYNEIILNTPNGSAAMRASASMKYRKVAKVHENMLVFYKGDQKYITELYEDFKLKINDDDYETE